MKSEVYKLYVNNCDYPYVGVEAAEKYLINNIKNNPLKRLSNFLDFGIPQCEIEVLAAKSSLLVAYGNYEKFKRNLCNSWVEDNMFEYLPYMSDFKYSRMWA